MNKNEIKALLDFSMGRSECDLAIRNAKVVDVYSKEVFSSDVYIADGKIVGFGKERKAKKEIDADGCYMIPGLIDAHCHIESSHLSPSEYSNAVVPRGTTTVIADPHEICNVCGLDGLEYMLNASEETPLSVVLMFPSCVPATPFEHAGAILKAEDIKTYIDRARIGGLGEMMDYPGVINSADDVLDKLVLAQEYGKNIDGHVPSITGQGLEAYISTGITTDHECETPEELQEKIRNGMYVMLREGTACKNVLQLLPGVTSGNSSRVLFCTDDLQPQSIITNGAVNYGVTLAIKAGLDPITAISMATLNASICYSLNDRGAIAPGKRADFLLVRSIEDGINPEKVFINGELVAENGQILKKAPHVEPKNVSGKVDISGFTKEKLALHLSSTHVRVINIIPGGVVTGQGEAVVKLDENGCWVHDSEEDILKLAVIERHKGTGNVGVALIRGYGMRHGAVATSIAHDSHNIIVVGDNDDDMEKAVRKLGEIGGGITMFKDGKELGTHRLEIAGLMTDDTVFEVAACLDEMHDVAYKELSVNPQIDPFMTLCFMSLPVIPAYKLTDTGLFDVVSFSFVPNELD